MDDKDYEAMFEHSPESADEVDWDHIEVYDVSELEAIGIHYEDAYDDDIPEGCAACGNPDYPKCCDSCPMFED